MTRLVTLALFCIFAVLVGYDTSLVIESATQPNLSQLNWAKIVISGVVQVSAVASAIRYSLFLACRPGSHSVSLHLKLLPLLVLGMLVAFSVVLLENGLLCGDQSFPSVRGRPICPKLPSQP